MRRRRIDTKKSPQMGGFAAEDYWQKTGGQMPARRQVRTLTPAEAWEVAEEEKRRDSKAASAPGEGQRWQRRWALGRGKSQLRCCQKA